MQKGKKYCTYIFGTISIYIEVLEWPVGKADAGMGRDPRSLQAGNHVFISAKAGSYAIGCNLTRDKGDYCNKDKKPPSRN